MVFIWCARRAPRMDRGWFARHFFFVTCSFLDAGNSVIHVASNRNVPPNTCVTTDACKAFCSNNSRPPNCSKCRLVVRHVLLITLFLTLYISRPRMPEIPRHTCARNYFHISARLSRRPFPADIPLVWIVLAASFVVCNSGRNLSFYISPRPI